MNLPFSPTLSVTLYLCYMRLPLIPTPPLPLLPFLRRLLMSRPLPPLVRPPLVSSTTLGQTATMTLLLPLSSPPLPPLCLLLLTIAGVFSLASFLSPAGASAAISPSASPCSFPSSFPASTLNRSFAAWSTLVGRLTMPACGLTHFATSSLVYVPWCAANLCAFLSLFRVVPLAGLPFRLPGTTSAMVYWMLPVLLTPSASLTVCFLARAPPVTVSLCTPFVPSPPLACLATSVLLSPCYLFATHSARLSLFGFLLWGRRPPGGVVTMIEFYRRRRCYRTCPHGLTMSGKRRPLMSFTSATCSLPRLPPLPPPPFPSPIPTAFFLPLLLPSMILLLPLPPCPPPPTLLTLSLPRQCRLLLPVLALPLTTPPSLLTVLPLTFTSATVSAPSAAMLAVRSSSSAPLAAFASALALLLSATAPVSPSTAASSPLYQGLPAPPP